MHTISSALSYAHPQQDQIHYLHLQILQATKDVVYEKYRQAWTHKRIGDIVYDRHSKSCGTSSLQVVKSFKSFASSICLEPSLHYMPKGGRGGVKSDSEANRTDDADQVDGETNLS